MTPLALPLWIPQALWVFGLAFFLLVVIALFVSALRLLIAGEFRGSRRLVGIQDVEAEAAEALADVRMMTEREESAT